MLPFIQDQRRSLIVERTDETEAMCGMLLRREQEPSGINRIYRIFRKKAGHAQARDALPPTG